MQSLRACHFLLGSPGQHFSTRAPLILSFTLSRQYMAPKGRRNRKHASEWVPRASVSTTPVESSPVASTAAVEIQEVAYPVKKGQLKVKSEVRATFYPKFENEKSDQEIRQKMIDVVSEGRGALEVSLKHSGSLFMYSGDGGAFAKNSYGNLYTAVGVYVLGKMLQQAWGEQAKDKQRELNVFLQKRRMCISMELVTAVLGDHGQRPLMDYAVVTAVAELSGRPKFYSTAELVAFCRQWRLPTNQVWLCSTRKAAAACFSAYDALCEEGIYTTVSDTLNQVADFTVPGTESHAVVQGEILEGLVARIVSSQSVERLKVVAKEHPVPEHTPGSYSAPGLREICAKNKQSERQQITALLQAVGPDFCSTYDDWLTKGSKDGADAKYLKQFLDHPPADDPTSKLQTMIKVLREKNMRVRFKCQPQGSENEFRMTVHVLQDSVFRRYQREMQQNSNLWPLYRGFFVDVKVSRDETDAKLEEALEQLSMADTQDALADDAQNLMIKLKFLPYKIRTFLIRNGLDLLFKNGHQRYKEYYLRQLKIWGTSFEKQQELMQLLDEWAVHITTKYKAKPTDGSYLSEAEPFLQRYAARNPKNQRLIGQAGTNISTEEFIANLRYDDEEGDLKQDEPPSAPLSTTEVKHKGMLVFFPGIPGCAKSALCREIVSTKGGLGDGRTIKSLMGDMIKGRYWPKLSEEREKNPSLITLADKNAPNEEVWKTVAHICKDTNALGVPIVPASEGTDSNPFSLDTLAVFIFRVLHREKHPGKLDKNAPYPGYVLLMFYNLYTGRNRSEFEADLLGRFGCLIKMPVLEADRPPFPAPIKSVLEEGMVLFEKHSAKHGKNDPQKGSFKKQWDEWEPKLKNVLFAHANYLNKIQVPFEEAVESVREQLKAVTRGDIQVPVPDVEERKFSSFTYAAMMVPVDDLLSALEKISSSNEKVKACLESKNLRKSLRSAHITLAHVRSHGIPAVAAYADSKGSQAPLKFTAIAFSDRACALEAHIMSDSVASKNPWPHVTLWTAPGVPPKEAGALGGLAKEGKATRLEFSQPITLTGTVEFKK